MLKLFLEIMHFPDNVKESFIFFCCLSFEAFLSLFIFIFMAANIYD